jgi:rhodanese-related sulfurtransferase
MFTLSTTHLAKPFVAPVAERELPEIDVFALEEALATEPENIILIDVRHPSEARKIRFQGSVLVPMAAIVRDGVDQIGAAVAAWKTQNGNRAPHVIVYCAGGVASAEAVEILEKAGITAINLKGGMRAWEQKIQPFHRRYLELGGREDQGTVPASLQKFQVPVHIRRLGLTTAALMMVGVAGWKTQKLMHNLELMRSLMASGVPLQMLEGVPYFGTAVQGAQVPQITVQDLAQTLKRPSTDYLLIDVRSIGEFQTAHISGAVSIPLTDIETGKGIEQIQQMLKGRQLMVYCTSGYRSGQALVYLQRAGIAGVQVKGGFEAWQASEKRSPDRGQNF